MKNNLIVGQEYDLKYAASFCHLTTLEGYKPMRKGDFLLGYTFLGKIQTDAGLRQIFTKLNTGSYVMFADSDDHLTPNLDGTTKTIDGVEYLLTKVINPL